MNRARQALVTQELAEIVAGAEAQNWNKFDNSSYLQTIDIENPFKFKNW